MVLPIRSWFQGRVYLEDASENPSKHQDLLARFFTIHRTVEPGISTANEIFSEDLRATFHSLSSEEQSHLRKVYGPKNVEVILNLATETNPQLFYEDFFHLGLAYEQENQFSFASLIYSLLVESAPNDVLRQRARHRNSVVQGEAPLGDHLEFLSGQFMEQLTDPAMFAGMVAASWSFGRVSSWALNSFSRRTFATRSLSWGLGFGTELNAFTFTVRGVRHLQGVSQDWSAMAVAQDLWRTGIMLAFLKGSGATAHATVGRIPSTGSLARFSHRALPQLFMYTGLLGAHGVEQLWGLGVPTAHPLLDSLVTLVHFNIAGRMLNTAFPHNIYGPFQGTDFPGRLLQRVTEWTQRKVPVPDLVTAEGTRVEPEIYSIGHNESEGAGGREKPGREVRVSESRDIPKIDEPETKVHYLAPIKFNRWHFEAVRDQYYATGDGLNSLVNEQLGTPLWHLQFRSMGLQLQALAQRVQQGLAVHPANESIAPVLQNIDGELHGINRLLHASHQAFPMAMDLARVRKLACLLYPNPNVMVNFIHSGSMAHLHIVLQATARSRLYLQEMFGGMQSPDLPALDPGQIRARDFLAFDPKTSRRIYPKYEWTEDVRDLTRDVEGKDNRLLLLGPHGEFRPSAFEDQKVTHLDQRSVRLEEVPDLSRALSGVPTAPAEGTFDYLEAHDLLRPEVIRSGEGETIMRLLATRLKPGGVGYLVHRDAQAAIGMAELLARHQLGDIIEGSLGAPLPVPSARGDAEYSNYIFFRRLPFR